MQQIQDSASSHSRLSRRSFCRRAAAMLAMPYVITGTALGAAGRAPASERIVMGTIGTGPRGMDNINNFLANPDVQMVAVCDVRGERRKAAKAAVDKYYGNQDCATYIDLRELLARTDIDAVMIATGDNWHTMASILAARAGKDIYCEKPMSVVLGEGRVLCETMQRYGVIFQCGTQRRSIARFRFAVELAQTGKLGQLKTLYAEKSPDWFGGFHEKTLPPEPEPPREVFDWDLWLGPAAWRPYNRKYAERNFWGGHRDFSGGMITEWGSHTVDLCQWANNADDTTPVEFEPAQGTIIAHYANGVKLVFEEGVWPLHVRFVGTEGEIYVDDDGNMRSKPESLLAGRKFDKGYPQANHVRNFLDCVKSRQRPIAPAEGAHRANSTCQIANICMLLGRPLRFDPQKEKFIGDPQADRMLWRAYRPPWRLV